MSKVPRLNIKLPCLIMPSICCFSAAQSAAAAGDDPKDRQSRSAANRAITGTPEAYAYGVLATPSAEGLQAPVSPPQALARPRFAPDAVSALRTRLLS
jgi:hypothetical protein